MGRVMVVRQLGVGVVVLSVSGSASAAADIATVLGPADLSAAPFSVECAGGSEPTALSDGIRDCIWEGTWWEEDLCLHRVDIDPAVDPAAICNDGTMASFYFRAATDTDDEAKWVIHLQGGGGCTDEATCRERWCGDSNQFYDAAMMSNDWDGVAGIDRDVEGYVYGISAPHADNPFATWNQVVIPYCTSDLWMGRDSSIDLGAFNVAARGHKIIQAVRSKLRETPGTWATVNGYYPPDLDDADYILFTGTSAGGYGVVQNGEFFLSTFPNAAAGLVVDGALDLGPEIIDDYDLWDEATNQPWLDRRLELWEDMLNPGGWWYEINAFVDESCRDYHTLAGDGLMECMSPTWMLRYSVNGVPFIETPTFLRMDIEDSVLSKWVVGPNPDGDDVRMSDNGPVPTLQDFTEMMRETMVRLAEDTESDLSVHAPRCGQHVGLEDVNPYRVWTNRDTTDTTPRAVGAVAITFADDLWEWFDPNGSFDWRRRIDTDEVDLVTGLPIHYSSCP